MADANGELLYEVLKAVQAWLEQVDGKVDEFKQEMQSFRTQMVSLCQEMVSVLQELGGIHAALVRHEQRLDRIDRWLELSDAPTG